MPKNLPPLTRSQWEAYYRSIIPSLTGPEHDQRGPCPIHMGNDPNFSVNQKTGQCHCHSVCLEGGDAIWLARQLGAKSFAEARAIVLEASGSADDEPAAKSKSPAKRPDQFKQVDTYEYWDASGRRVYRVVRLEQTNAEKGEKPAKRFRQEAFKDGRWVCAPRCMEGVERVPYRLPAVVKQISTGKGAVFIVEGEKAVHYLETLGLVATTSPEGAGKWRAEMAKYFQGAKSVIVLPDNDLPGCKHAADVAGSLIGVAKTVQILELPDLPPKGDAVDWIAAGGTVQQLRELVKAKQYVGPEGLEAFRKARAIDSEEAKPAAKEEKRPRKEGPPAKFRIHGDELQYEVEQGEWLRLCRKLEIVAVTRGIDGDSWGRLLRWHDDDGREHLWAMPIRLADGESTELMSSFSDRGLDTPIGRKRERLIEYLKSFHVEERAICCEVTGWHGPSFVLPHRCVSAQGADLVYFQSAGKPDSRYAQSGSIEQWQSNIARYCAGNSRLVLAVCAAFGAALLKPLEVESGGIHFTGTTSSGKSTALMVAGSVCGGGEGRGFVHQWRATGNGLEALAQSHNDGLLVLDELAQLDARETAEALYLLSNGAGKARMQRTGALRKSAQWRVLFLSAGELKLADHAETAGKRLRGGAEVRCLDLVADAGCDLGIFQELHSFESAASLADHLKSQAAKCYGTPLLAFLECLVKETASSIEKLKDRQRQFATDQLKELKDPPGEIRRGLNRFALLAVAGELATAYGITGWEPGEADRAAETCFRAWLRGRGGAVQSDDDAALSQVRRFIEQHGASRFQSFEVRYTSDGEPVTEKIMNRAGFVRYGESGDQEFLFLPEVFKSEVCKGFRYDMVLKVLESRGLLRRLPGHWTVSMRIQGANRRVYQVLGSILDSADMPN